MKEEAGCMGRMGESRFLAQKETLIALLTSMCISSSAVRKRKTFFSSNLLKTSSIRIHTAAIPMAAAAYCVKLQLACDSKTAWHRHTAKAMLAAFVLNHATQSSSLNAESVRPAWQHHARKMSRTDFTSKLGLCDARFRLSGVAKLCKHWESVDCRLVVYLILLLLGTGSIGSCGGPGNM